MIRDPNEVLRENRARSINYKRDSCSGLFSWWSPSYLVDYALVGGISVVAFVIPAKAPMFMMPTPFDDLPVGINTSYTISMPAVPESIDSMTLYSIGYGIPLLVFFVHTLIRPLYRREAYRIRAFRFEDMHAAVLALLLAMSICGLATQSLKVSSGRLRPDFVSRMASGDEKRIRDGRSSFPSGHASTSACGMAMLSLWICGKLRVYRYNEAWRLCVCLLPYVLAFYVAVTRTQEHYHNHSDVMAGFLLGLASSCISYFLYYPSLGAELSAEPKLRSLEAHLPLLPGSLSNPMHSIAYERPHPHM